MKKRLFAMFLALTMALSLMPTMAMAEGETWTEVASAEALTEALQTGGNIKLTQSFTTDQKQDWEIKVPVVLDLNGNTITSTYGANNSFLMTVNGGSLTITDESPEKSGSIKATDPNHGYGIQLKGTNSHFTLLAGTIETTQETVDIYDSVQNVSINISGGKLVSTDDNVLGVRGNRNITVDITGGEMVSNGRTGVYISSYAEPSPISFTMTGGTLSHTNGMSGAIQAYKGVELTIGGDAVIESASSYGIQAQENTVLNVDGGAIRSTSNSSSISCAGNSTVNITGGTVETNSSWAAAVRASDNSKVSVSDGKIIGSKALDGAKENITVTGGKFTSKVDEQYLEEGLTQGQDGTVGKQDDVSVAELWRNGERISRHLTLEEALEKAQNNDTVKLVAGKEISLTNRVEISGKVLTLDLNGSTIKAGSGFQKNQIIYVKADGNLTIMDSSADQSGVVSGATYALYLEGAGTTVVVQGGIFIGNENAAIVTAGAALEVTGGTLTVANYKTATGQAAVHAQIGSSLKISGGEIIGGEGENASAIDAISSKVEISGNARLTGFSGVELYNLTEDGKLSNAPGAISSSLTMTGGTIEAKSFALSGNNTQSAGSMATISGGTLTANDGTAIYWPMEGKLTIGGDAVIIGGTGIEAKMGTITIQDHAQVIGAAAYKADEPANGGSSPEGSALLLSAQMYGMDGQYQTSNQLKVSISGGTLTSNQGNAVTVYNTEKNEVQTAQVTVSGGTFTAEKAAIISVTKGDNTVTTDGNTQTTSKSKTTLTVSGSVAPASIDANGKTTYYTDVTKAIQSVSQDADTATQITVFGNTTISTDVVLHENITLVVTPGTQLSADVTSGESNMVVVTEKDAKGNTVYKLVETPTNPEQTYVASITANGQTAYFQTLADAVKTVQDGQTITLLKNSDTVGAITISRVVTFTLDLKTFTMKDTITAGSGFVLTRSGNTYTVSVYVPPVTPPQPDDRPSGGSDSSSSSDGDYIVSVDTGKHGTVTVSPKRADKGDTVTITVKPDKGYELDELVVTDKNGDAVKLKDKGNGKFSFTMPGSKVTVEAKFVKESASQLPFADVSADYWAYDEIAWAYENGYMNGTSATAFNPGGNVSRQQLWMILARLSGASPASMAEAREWAIGNGISDGSNPGGAISRQQMVATLYRYAKLMGYDTTGAADLTAFPDHASVADYAKEAMAWSVKNEIVGGTAQGTLNPAGTASRAQFAVILYRFVK